MDKGTIRQINSHVWLLRDEHNDTCYLVTGKEKALLIDTMCGYVNVREMAESITLLPLLVANTHGHGDHIFGNVWFREAMLHPSDLPMTEEMLRDPEVCRIMKEQHVSMSAFRPIQNGDLIDLGNLTLEVIALPGHTPGSVCFLLREDRILFTGDAINRHLWMQLNDCLTLKAYAENIRSILWVKEKADIILHGHASGPEDISLTDKMLRGLTDIIAGNTGADTPYQWHGGTARQHPFDENSVIVYGSNIG